MGQIVNSRGVVHLTGGDPHQRTTVGAALDAGPSSSALAAGLAVATVLATLATAPRTTPDIAGDTLTVKSFGGKANGVRLTGAASGAAGQAVVAINGASATKAPPVAGQQAWVQGGGTATTYSAAGTMANGSNLLTVAGQTFTHTRTWMLVRVTDGVSAGVDLVTYVAYVPNGWNAGGAVLQLAANCTNPSGVSSVNVVVSGHLFTTVASVSGNNVTLAANLGAAVSASDVLWGTDDTAAWQAGNDVLKAAGGGTLAGIPGTISCIKKAGAQTAAGIAGFPYALKISNNIVFDGRGSTLALMGGNEAAWIINENSNALTDTNIGIKNFTVDFLSTPSAGAMVGMLIYGVTGLTTDNITVRRSMRVGGEFASITRHNADNLEAIDCIGAGWLLGITTGKINRARYGRIYAENIPAYTGNSSLPGNTIVCSINGGTIAAYIGYNADGAHKITDGSNFTVALSYWEQSIGTSGNSGTKLQGSTDASSLTGATIGQVVTKGAAGIGLFVNNCNYCGVSSFLGIGNATAGSSPDVDLNANVDNFRLPLGISSGAGYIALSTAATHVRTVLGSFIARNPATNGAQVGINHSGGALLYDNIEATDDRGGSALMTRGISCAAGTLIQGKKARLLGWTSFPINMPTTANGSYVGEPTVDETHPIFGTFSPATSATTTAVTNNNVKAFGSFIIPIVEIQPANAAAQTLATTKALRYTYSANTLTAQHSAAAGTELFRYRIKEVIYNATNFT